MRTTGLEPIETASSDELSSLQLRRLRWTLHHAYDNVAFDRNSFDAAGVHPNDVASLTDPASFPCATQAALRRGTSNIFRWRTPPRQRGFPMP